MSEKTLAGQAAIVTGGGRGIGHKISAVLADAGAAVAIVDWGPSSALA